MPLISFADPAIRSLFHHISFLIAVPEKAGTSVVQQFLAEVATLRFDTKGRRRPDKAARGYLVPLAKAVVS